MKSYSFHEKTPVIDKVVQSLGLNDLKQQQQSAFYIWRDIFVALPTGYGKSMIYACFPRVFFTCCLTEKDLLISQSHSISIQICSWL